jgi:multimeric flavodoxin WrbA
MQALILIGSPRKNGNTEILVKAISEELQRHKTTVKQFRLAELEIHPCIGCGSCEKKGICVIKDDMQVLYTHIVEADIIILASPIYFYGLTAQTKAFVDRCQALWSRKYILKQRISLKKNRKGYLVSVAATRGERVFEGAKLCARYGLDAMDAPYCEGLFYSGVDSKGAVKNHPDFPDKLLAFIHQILTK